MSIEGQEITDLNTLDALTETDYLFVRNGIIDYKILASEIMFPPGITLPYGGSTAPTGWLLCNGAAISRTTYANLFAIIGTTFGVGDGSTTFNLPDLRGIFIRGAGDNGTLNDANGNPFSGTLGTYSNDQFQGHIHTREYLNDLAGGGGGSEMKQAGATGNTFNTSSPVTDGVNGTPRTGTETNPANLGLNFIIKI